MSESSQHHFTPGPWVALADEDDDEGFRVAAGPNQSTVATVEPETLAGIEIANARLIAAAPELLDALSELLTAEDECVLSVAKEALWDVAHERRMKARAAARRALDKALGSQQNHD